METASCKHENLVHTRRQNLRVLAQMRPGKHKELAIELGWSESRMSQLIGRNPVRPVTEKVALHVEHRLGIANGWLSEERPDVWHQHGLTDNEG